MCSLSLFPAPVTAGLTLREHNNELVPGQPDTQWSDLPSPQFTRDTLKGHSRPESSSKSAFLDQRDTLWMRSAGACTGATEVTSVTISENNRVMRFITSAVIFSSLMMRAGQPVTHMRSTNSKPQPSNQFPTDKIKPRPTSVLV